MSHQPWAGAWTVSTFSTLSHLENLEHAMQALSAAAYMWTVWCKVRVIGDSVVAHFAPKQRSPKKPVKSMLKPKSGL